MEKLKKDHIKKPTHRGKKCKLCMATGKDHLCVTEAIMGKNLREMIDDITQKEINTDKVNDVLVCLNCAISVLHLHSLSNKIKVSLSKFFVKKVAVKKIVQRRKSVAATLDNNNTINGTTANTTKSTAVTEESTKSTQLQKRRNYKEDSSGEETKLGDSFETSRLTNWTNSDEAEDNEGVDHFLQRSKPVESDSDENESVDESSSHRVWSMPKQTPIKKVLQANQVATRADSYEDESDDNFVPTSNPTLIFSKHIEPPQKNTSASIKTARKSVISSDDGLRYASADKSYFKIETEEIKHNTKKSSKTAGGKKKDDPNKGIIQNSAKREANTTTSLTVTKAENKVNDTNLQLPKKHNKSLEQNMSGSNSNKDMFCERGPKRKMVVVHEGNQLEDSYTNFKKPCKRNEDAHHDTYKQSTMIEEPNYIEKNLNSPEKKKKKKKKLNVDSGCSELNETSTENDAVPAKQSNLQCHICSKHLANEYNLLKHKLKKHGNAD